MNGHNVADALREHARTRPDAVAIRFPSAGYTTDAPAWDGWTYAQLDRESDAYARGFVAAGVKRGDRTLFLVKPSLDFYAALFEYLIKDYNKDSGGKYAEYYTPHAVARIMAAIDELIEGYTAPEEPDEDEDDDA